MVVPPFFLPQSPNRQITGIILSMDLNEFRLKTIGIDKSLFGRVYTFVDFGNVNYWYEKDRRDSEGKSLANNQKLIIDIQKLADFLNFFSIQKRFYYGWHKRIRRSWHIVIWAEKNGFVKITKPIQFIRHYLDELELGGQKSHSVKQDARGKFIEVPKSNFDVEITIDSIRLLDRYDTLCLLSGDSDFAPLLDAVKIQRKRTLVMSTKGHISKELLDRAKYINLKKLKDFIAFYG